MSNCTVKFYTLCKMTDVSKPRGQRMNFTQGKPLPIAFPLPGKCEHCNKYCRSAFYYPVSFLFWTVLIHPVSCRFLQLLPFPLFGNSFCSFLCFLLRKGDEHHMSKLDHENPTTLPMTLWHMSCIKNSLCIFLLSCVMENIYKRGSMPKKKDLMWRTKLVKCGFW